MNILICIFYFIIFGYLIYLYYKCKRMVRERKEYARQSYEYFLEEVANLKERFKNRE